MEDRFYKEIGAAVARAKKNNGSLTEQNLLYVVKIATDMSKKTGVEFDDLLKAGVIAMKLAEEKYDPSQNDNFVKYAAASVRGYMLNVVNRQNSLVHIPANQMPGFKKGQEKSEEAKVEYNCIDASNYDTLGTDENGAFYVDKEAILEEGLKRLDINGRIAIEMKLRRGKYGEKRKAPTAYDPDHMEYVYKNDFKSIAEELEVTPIKATKIYKEAFEKISKYCSSEYNG